MADVLADLGRRFHDGLQSPPFELCICRTTLDWDGFGVPWIGINGTNSFGLMLEIAMRVWVLHLNGAFSICENFRQVMRSVIVRLIPNSGDQSCLRLMDQYPELTAIGAQGSFYQLVRYLNARPVAFV